MPKLSTSSTFKLIGRWKIEKQFPLVFNAKYPDLACQFLYVAEITQIKPFSSEYEVTERALVAFTDVARYHLNFGDFEEIFNFILGEQPF